MHLKYQIVLLSLKQVKLHGVRSKTKKNIQAHIFKANKNIGQKMEDDPSNNTGSHRGHKGCGTSNSSGQNRGRLWPRNKAVSMGIQFRQTLTEATIL